MRRRANPEDRALLERLAAARSQLANLKLKGPGRTPASQFESEVARLGAEARAHIVAQYGLERMASLYARTYEALCKSGPR